MVKKWLSHFSSLPVLAITGLVIAAMVVVSKPGMSHATAKAPAKTVLTFSAKKNAVKPAIVGFGEVKPDVLLDTKAEIAGKVTYIHPLLKKGNFLSKGTVVVKIDPQDHKLALTQAKADLAASQASLSEGKLSLENAKADLDIAQQKLELNQKEWQRMQKLAQKGSVSTSSLEKQRATYLQAKQEMQSLTTRVKTLPFQLDVLQARIDIAKAAVEVKQRNLERTEIKLPYNVKLSEVLIEQSQFVTAGALLFKAETVDKVIVEVRFPVSQFQQLAKGFSLSQEGVNRMLDATRGETIDPALADQFNLRAENVIKKFNLRARVKSVDIDTATWEGRVERLLGDIDPVTRTIGVVIGVDNPYRDIKPGVKPPLIHGLYVSVTLTGDPQALYVIPRYVLHGNEIYTVNKEQQLQRLTVAGYPSDGAFLIESGLDEGTEIISSDLFPAVPGMLLSAKADEQAQTFVKTWVESHQ